jgi:hypothetical protein
MSIHTNHQYSFQGPTVSQEGSHISRGQADFVLHTSNRLRLFFGSPKIFKTEEYEERYL